MKNPLVRMLTDLRQTRLGWIAAAALAMCACAGTRTKPPDEPTLAQLPARALPAESSAAPPLLDDDATQQAYEAYLRGGGAPEREAKAVRRLGDLALGRAEKSVEGGQASASEKAALQAAVALYRRRLQTDPDRPDNDGVWYQLARAYELLGDADAALSSLDALVSHHPQSPLRDEAEFRRGEWLFTMRRYAAAAAAYDVLAQKTSASTFGERALYMRGWCRFKQGLLDDAIVDFLAVLDAKLPQNGAGEAAAVSLARPDQELVDDTLRVTSLSLANLQGAASIHDLMSVPGRRRHAYRLYAALANLYAAQDRSKDAADTLRAFVDAYPSDAQAPAAMSRVIAIFAQAGLAGSEWQARRDFVRLFDADGAMARSSPDAWQAHARPQLKAILLDLAHHDHARSQSSHEASDRALALAEYDHWLQIFNDDTQVAAIRFLRAELLFEDHRFAQAIDDYETVAYVDPPSANRAESGYAALLAYAALARQITETSEAEAISRRSIDSALRFAAAFDADPRTPGVLLDAAGRAFAAHDLASARAIAARVVGRQPAAGIDLERRAWRIQAQASFELGDYAASEHAVAAEISLGGLTESDRTLLNDRLALSIYRQAEALRAQERNPEAVAAFLRVGRDAAGSSVEAPACFDAAALLIAGKQWDAARGVLVDFRQRFAHHPLQAGVAAKLAVVQLELGHWGEAADEFERVIAQGGEAEAMRSARWQIAELRHKDGDERRAQAAYRDYAARYPEPFAANIEARSRLLELQQHPPPLDEAERTAQDLISAEASGAAARTDRTRLQGSHAALFLAQRRIERFRAVALIEPLKTQLKLKKARMEEALSALVQASGFGVAETMTQANYLAAELYREFGAAMLDSERPAGLGREEREQYDVLLEEQAFPFEERSVTMHESNAHLVRDGLYDAWIRDSYAALARIRPIRYGKAERDEEVVHAIR